jgi:hypothetical protein
MRRWWFDVVLVLCIAACIGIAAGASPVGQPATLTPSVAFTVPTSAGPCEAVSLAPAGGPTLVVAAGGKLVLYRLAPVNTPTPDDPVKPVELTGLAKDSRDWAVAGVPADVRARDAVKLASAYRDVATRIRTGQLATLADAMAAQTEANRAALGLTAETAAASPWLPWIKQVAGHLVSAGYVTPTDPSGPLADVLDELAKGLDAAK